MGIGAIGDAVGGLLGGGGGSVVEGVVPTSLWEIKINGAFLPLDLEQQVEAVVVNDRLQMPASFAITFRDPMQDVISRSKIKVGAQVKISVGSPGFASPNELMAGEVTSIETEYDRLGTRATIRGYDVLHRLSAGTNARTWENVTISDVVKKIAGEAGIAVSARSTTTTLKHLIQPNVTDLQFIHYLASLCGYAIWVEGEKLHFEPPNQASKAPGAGDDTSMDPLQLVWGQRLIELRARISAVGQVADVEVRGWNPATQQVIRATARGGTESVSLPTSVSKLAGVSDSRTFSVTDQPLQDTSSAGPLARAVAEQIGSAAYEATALVVGAPELKAGVAVNISKVDPELAGKWVITAARHEFGNGAYQTFLEFSGRQDRSLLGLAGGGGPATSPRATFPGVVTAKVSATKGKASEGWVEGATVRVTYDWLGDKMQSGWARVASLGAADLAGLMWLPDVGDEVLVAFEHGDINYPVVIASLWSEKAKPVGDVAQSEKNGKFLVHGLATKGKHQILLREQQDKEEIEILTGDKKAKILLDQKNKKLELFLDGTELTITTKGDLKLTAEGSVAIEGKKGVQIKSGAKLEVSASGDATIKGAKVAVN